MLNTKLMLSSSLMCDQIYECPRYDVGYALLYYLRQTWMFQLTYLCIVMKENHQAMLIGLWKQLDLGLWNIQVWLK